MRLCFTPSIAYVVISTALIATWVPESAVRARSHTRKWLKRRVTTKRVGAGPPPPATRGARGSITNHVPKAVPTPAPTGIIYMPTANPIARGTTRFGRTTLTRHENRGLRSLAIRVGPMVSAAAAPRGPSMPMLLIGPMSATTMATSGRFASLHRPSSALLFPFTAARGTGVDGALILHTALLP